jgi:hypothetical protein
VSLDRKLKRKKPKKKKKKTTNPPPPQTTKIVLLTLRILPMEKLYILVQFVIIIFSAIRLTDLISIEGK